MTADGLTIPASMVEDLLAHARSERPNEACGLLAGDLASGLASAFHPTRNAVRSPYRFDVDADDLVRVVLGIEASGEDLVAVFHSHVRSEAVPSASDAREARYPVIQLIASLVSGSLRAWRLEAGGSREVPLLVG